MRAAWAGGPVQEAAARGRAAPGRVGLELAVPDPPAPGAEADEAPVEPVLPAGRGRARSAI